jgi:hypothetical protein
MHKHLFKGIVVASVTVLFLIPASPALAKDNTIRVAIIPDTQAETYSTSAKRARWIARRSFDAVAHVGDVTDWGARDWRQFKRARKWVGLLPSVPRAIAVGNHDTGAVGVGGSAFDPPRTGFLLRDTLAFNRAALVPVSNVSRQWELNKVDNMWVPVGKRWGLLTLELWPRVGAVQWANQVVKSNPKRSWIIVTHACLNRNGSISGSNGYGTTSPRYLRDSLVRPNRNVRVVLCGHIGTTAVKHDRHTSWILTNRTIPGLVRVLRIDDRQVRTWLKRRT